MLRVLAGVVVIAALGTACGPGETEAGPSPSPSGPKCADPGPRASGTGELPAGYYACVMEAGLTVKVEGAESIDEQLTTQVVVNELYGESLPKETWFVNLGTVTPIEFAEKKLFRVGFDLAPGTYRGPRTYELTKTRPKLQGLESGLTDKAFVEVNSFVPENPGLFRYADLLEPCSLTVTSKLVSGTLECPKLGRLNPDDTPVPDGGTVSLTVEWEPAASG